MPGENDNQNGQNNQGDPNNPGAGGAGGQNNQGGGTLGFDDWLKGQSDDAKALVAGYLDTSTTGLKSALQKERDQVKAMNVQLKDLSGKVEKGSEAEKTINDLTTKLTLSERRNTFLTEAPTHAVADVKAALVLAEAEGLIGDDGAVKWDDLKRAHPIFFAPPRTEAPGTNSQNRGKASDLNVDEGDIKTRFGLK